jgi:hypothetical protein
VNLATACARHAERNELSALAHPQVLQELEEQVDAAQRRATESMEEARVRMDEVRARSYSTLADCGAVPRRCCAAGR